MDTASQAVQSSPIDDIVIGKAKKREGYYICPIGCEERKVPFIICLNKAKIISVKETSNTIVVKCKNATRYMDDLNEKIINIVRTNSSSWFNSSIDTDLIDEFYISTLQYDRKLGETIRIKCSNPEDIEEKHLQTPSHIILTLKHLKFYKQKFFAEFQVEDIDVDNANTLAGHCFVDDDDEQGAFSMDDEDECPLPSVEEVMAIKNDTLTKLGELQTQLTQEVQKLNTKLENICDFVQKIETTKDLYQIIKMCEDIEILNCD
jgi:hypothetical protein